MVWFPALQDVCVCLFGLVLYVIGRLVWGKRAPLPPGPPGWPLIGNILDIPEDAAHKTFGAIGRKYGPIISLNLMGMRYVVLNSPKAVKDLLEKKSAITSSRPHLTMASDLVGWRDNTAFLQYDDTHRRHRKFFHHQIGTKNSLEVFYPVEVAEAKKFLNNVLKNPEGLIAHSYRIAGAVILKISHGYTVTEDNDPLVEMANKTLRMFSVVSTGRFIVDLFPILRYLPEWFPGGGFHKDAKQWRKMLRETVDVPHQFVLDQIAKGNASQSFTSRLLQQGVSPEEEEFLKWASFSMYLGGSDTTSASLSAFFLAMTIYPDILQKAQVEVDTVVGDGRLPTMDDRNALPYVNALCTELLRWHVVVPLAIHLTTEDSVYDGYFIPKGACLTANTWYILSDPNIYPDPDAFRPERFLGENKQPDPREVCFGYGRRSCPGAHLADLTIFTCVAMALATLNVLRCVENGVECIPSYDATEGPIRHVKPFKCRIVPRSKKAEELLQG